MMLYHIMIIILLSICCIDAVTIMFNPVTYTVTEGDSNVMLNITFVTSEPLIRESTIRITSIPTAGATNQATAGVDYVAFNQTITLPAGSTGHFYTVIILSNPEDELPEQFSVTLEYVTGSQLTFNGPNATVTINVRNYVTINVPINDVNAPTIRFQPVTYTAVEGRNGQAAIVTVRGVTSQPLLENTTIRLTDVPTPGATDPATRDADYTGFDQNIVLPAGAMDFSYNVTILSDDIVEESEMFDVDLSYVSGSPLTVTGSDATVTIVDSSVILLMFSAHNYIVPEDDGSVTLNITASAPVTTDTVISLTGIETSGGASSTSDFGPIPATVTIPSGQSSVSFPVNIRNDAIPEPTESFDVRMALQSGQSIVVPSGTDTTTVTITDTDRSVISYSPRTVFRHEEDSPAPLRIIVEPKYFETFQFESFSVQFSDQNDLAQAGVDYISFNDTLTAVNGSGPILHSVLIRDDEIMEPTEEFGVRLNVLGNARVDVAQSVDLAKVVIEDTETESLTVSYTESTTSINVIPSTTSNAKSISTIIPTTSIEYSSSTIIPSYSVMTSLITTVTSSLPVDDDTGCTQTPVTINVGITVALVISGLINVIFIIISVSVLLYLKTSKKSLTNNRPLTEASNMVYERNESYQLHKITNETGVYEDVKDI